MVRGAEHPEKINLMRLKQGTLGKITLTSH